MTMLKKFTHDALFVETNDEYKQITLMVQTKREICSCCYGYGYHFRTDLDENKLVESFEEDGDYDGYNSYTKGEFDEICESCNGEKVVDAIDWNWFKQKYPQEYEKIHLYEKEAYEDRKYAQQERRALGY